jgi:hypothetical protein
LTLAPPKSQPMTRVIAASPCHSRPRSRVDIASRSVIPAKAGIQLISHIFKLDSGFRRNDAKWSLVE